MAPNVRWRPGRTHIMIAVVSLIVLSAAVHVQSTTAQKETLTVAVAQWRQSGHVFQDVQQRTFERLVNVLSELDLNVGIIMVPVELQNAADVDAVAAMYDIDVLVWGWYDETAVRGYVDLANAIEENGMTNSLREFLENGGSPEVIQVLSALSNFDYRQDGVSFCVPRWTP